MGKVRSGDRLTRALYIAKHRGSACDERIVPYRIDDGGVRIVFRNINALKSAIEIEFFLVNKGFAFC